MRSKSSQVHAFTLVELLVVVAIMALLAAVLIPSLAKARAAAVRTKCLSHARSMMHAIHAYSVDHNGTIPYGPTAPPPSPSNLYPVTGLVTSQLSLADGRPMALGLLLSRHLDNQTSILFCPGADEKVDAKRELAKVGKRQAICGYYYRHGSNTLATAQQPHDTWDDRIKLENLGKNSNGKPIRALIVDQNFLTSVPLAPFGIVNRTNHRQEWVNAAFADGHAESIQNADRKYTVNVGNFPFDGPNKILTVFERLDER